LCVLVSVFLSFYLSLSFVLRDMLRLTPTAPTG